MNLGSSAARVAGSEQKPSDREKNAIVSDGSVKALSECPILPDGAQSIERRHQIRHLLAAQIQVLKEDHGPVGVNSSLKPTQNDDFVTLNVQFDDMGRSL